MKREEFNLTNMTVEDLFRAKQERRQRLAALSFEQKIEIVKKLRSVSRTIRASQDQPQSPEEKPSANP